MNLYLKFILLCLILVFFTSLSLFFFTSQEAKQIVKEELVFELNQQATHSIHNIERFVYQRLSDIQAIAQNPSFRLFKFSKNELTNALKNLKKFNQLYFSFSYFDMNRIRLADSEGLSMGQKHSLNNYWRKIEAGEELVMDISLSESVGKIVIHFAAVVKDADNQPLGVVVSRVLIERLYEVFDDFSTSKDFNQFIKINLIDRNQFILYSNHRPQSVLKDKFVYPKNLQTIVNQGFMYYENDNDFYFQAKESSSLSYKGNQWILIINIPKEIALKPITNAQNKLFFLFIPILGIAILLTLFIAHLFVNPILKLSKIALEIGDGNLDAEIKVKLKSKDELGILARQLKKNGAKT